MTRWSVAGRGRRSSSATQHRAATADSVAYASKNQSRTEIILMTSSMQTMDDAAVSFEEC